MMFNIESLRKEQGLTQEQLAEKSGVARSLINQLETGKRNNANTVTLGKIAHALNCKITDLFSESKV